MLRLPWQPWDVAADRHRATRRLVTMDRQGTEWDAVEGIDIVVVLLHHLLREEGTEIMIASDDDLPVHLVVIMVEDAVGISYWVNCYFAYTNAYFGSSNQLLSCYVLILEKVFLFFQRHVLP